MLSAMNIPFRSGLRMGPRRSTIPNLTTVDDIDSPEERQKQRFSDEISAMLKLDITRVISNY
jgi:hypothetical protein